MDSEVIEAGTSAEELEVARGDELTARRAYEIYASGEGSSDFDNWLRAERELDEEQHAYEDS